MVTRIVTVIHSCDDDITRNSFKFLSVQHSTILVTMGAMMIRICQEIHSINHLLKVLLVSNQREFRSDQSINNNR